MPFMSAVTPALMSGVAQTLAFQRVCGISRAPGTNAADPQKTHVALPLCVFPNRAGLGEDASAQFRWPANVRSGVAQTLAFQRVCGISRAPGRKAADPQKTHVALPLCVFPNRAGLGEDASVQFDGQPMFAAVKINDSSVNPGLSTEF
jgi:hypothetical protein